MGSIHPTTEKSGRRFLKGLATTICKECHAEWHWDETAQPDYYRLTVSDDKTSITFARRFEINTTTTSATSV